MPYDPGPYVKLQIAPADITAPPAPATPPVSVAPTTIYQTAPATVVYSETVYVPTAPVWVTAYPPYPYRPSIGFNLQYSTGGHRHGHWR